MKKFLYLLLATAMLATFGCTGDSNTNSVGSPNPNTLMPTGTVQGILKDACTNEPIVGAIIDIGVAKATTNETGQYVMKKVPATSYVSPTALTLLSGYSGSYSATIDLRKAKNAVTGKNNYPQFSYDEVSVAFSSLAETSLAKAGIVSNPNGAVAAGAAGAASSVTSVSASVSTTNATNHDTPVVGLGNGDFDFYVGQLTTAISGVAVTADLKTVPDGYTVNLYSRGSHWDGNSSTGARDHLIATAKTVNGRFTFSGLEARQRFTIEVVDKADDVATMFGTESSRTRCDGTTWFGVQDGDPIVVRSTDTMCPFITSATPADFTDVDPATAGGIKVVFNFSEPIAKTDRNSGKGLTASGVNGLYKYVYVYFAGNKADLKAGNIPHTLSWNDTMTALTVTIPTVGKASGYVVGIHEDAAALLSDASGNALTPPLGTHNKTCRPWTKAATTAEPVPTLQQCVWSTANLDDLKGKWFCEIVYFTTYGAAGAGRTTLSIVDESSLDYNSPINFSWTAAAGAKSYNLYCATNQVWGSTVNTHTTARVNAAPITNTTWTLTPNSFVENNSIMLTRTCYVVGVDADGIEGAKSNEVTAKDNVSPEIVGTNLSAAIGTRSFWIQFSEPMVKAAAQNTANYTLNPDAFTGTVPRIIGAVYSEATLRVTLTLDRVIEGLNMGSINTGLNGRLETLRDVRDNAVEGVVIPNGQPNSPCITSNAAAGVVVPVGLAQADDLYQILPGQTAMAGQVIVNSGPNGRCQSTAIAGMTQNLTPVTPTNPLGNGTPNWVAITAAVGDVLHTTTLAGDDRLSNAPVFVTVGNSVTDIAIHSLKATANAIRTDGQIE